MAHMIPGYGPAETDPRAREDLIYDSLSRLDDNWWVIHSCRVLSRGDDGGIEESEGDFVVFNRELGVMVIEAKYTYPRCIDGEWYYGGGVRMKDDPYDHADRVMWKIRNLLYEKGLDNLAESCKFAHAVWFHKLKAHELSQIEYPTAGLREITLCGSDLDDPEKVLKSVFARTKPDKRCRLSESEAKIIREKILFPTFNVIPDNQVDYGYNDFFFKRLLESQAKVLHFLDDQRSVAISGAAGTGKTLIAVARAKQAAKTGKVLFLCFNRLLKDDIERRCGDEPNIKVYNVDGYALSLRAGDYYELAEKIEGYGANFPYDHIVIDEGQDFGRKDQLSDSESESESDSGQEQDDRDGGLSFVLDALISAAEKKDNGTIYVFYDSRQRVQSACLPSSLMHLDSKISLYVNCRNTIRIASCSLKSIKEEKRRGEDRPDLGPGKTPVMLVSDDASKQKGFIDGQIEALRASGLSDIVILTCKTLKGSKFSEFISPKDRTARWRGTNVPVRTCRTFKGLEADAVILIDVNEKVWLNSGKQYDGGEGMLFYTGASRAKHELRIVCDMDDDACGSVLEHLGVNVTRNRATKLAKALGAERVG